MQIAFLIAQPDMQGSCLNQNNLVLTKMFVPRYGVSRKKVFRTHYEMLRSVVLGTDLERESSWRRIAPYSLFAFIPFQQERSWAGFMSGQPSLG